MSAPDAVGSYDALAEAAGIDPALIWRPDEWPSLGVLSALKQPVSNHPKTTHDVIYVTTRPLAFDVPANDVSPDVANYEPGGIEHRGAGEVLLPEEIERSHFGFNRLLQVGDVVAFPSDTGVFGTIRGLLARIERLEAVIVERGR